MSRKIHKEKREETQILVSGMKEGISLQYIKRVIRKYYKHVNSCKFNNLDEIKQFLENHKQPKITQDKTDNLNSLINIKEIESVVKNLPKKKFPGPVVSLADSKKYLKKK